jgi:uncharacterized protein with GYD domain
LGGELKAFYMLQGQYDGVLIFDIPNDEALTRFLLTTGTAGNVRTTTLRAFTEEELKHHRLEAGGFDRRLKARLFFEPEELRNP